MSCNRTVVCRPVGDQSAISRRSVGERSATYWRSVGDWLATVSCAFVFLIAESVQLFGDRSAICRRPKLCRDCLQLLGDQSPTSRRPVGDHQKPFYDRFGRREVLLAATKTSLRSNRPCNRLQPVGDQSPTSLQPPCNLPATTRNFGHKEVADQLQAMCDWGFSSE